MRLLTWVYVNLKVMVKQFPVTILYMIGLPLFIGFLMGNMMTMLFENPNNIEPIRIQIIDEDQSTLSNQFITFLSDESLQPYIEISDESLQVTLTIPKGYEEALLNQTENTLVLTKEESKNNHALSLSTLQQLLNQYHEQFMVNLSDETSDILSLIYNKSSLTSEYVDTPLQINSHTYYSISMMGFFIFMMILNFTAAGYKTAELSLNKRFSAIPLTRLAMFNYDFIGNLIYCFILLFIYVLFYRLIGYSFTGSFGLLMLIVLATSLFTVSIGCFIKNFFSSKYGYLISYLLFFIQIFVGGSFMPMKQLQFLSPSQFIVQMFNQYILVGTWESIQSPFLIVLAIGLTLYGLTCLKEKYHWWEV